MDELLTAPALPPTQPLATPPSGAQKQHHAEPTVLSRLGLVLGAGIGGAVALVIILLILIWLTTKL